MSAANELPEVWVNVSRLVVNRYPFSKNTIHYVPAARLAALEREVAELREALRHEVIEPHTVVGRSYFGGYCVLCGHMWGDRPETHEPGCLAALRAEPTGERRE